jgi:hypothetical protein
MEEAGVVAKCDCCICSKIQQIVKSYQNTHQHKNQTGHGTCDQQKMDIEVYGKCRHYDLLDPILGGWPSMNPLLTNKSDVANPDFDFIADVGNEAEKVAEEGSFALLMSPGKQFKHDSQPLQLHQKK